MDILAYLKDSSTTASSWMSRVTDLMLAGLIIAIIALMILPLPVFILDLLVALNIAVGVMLVLMGIYVSKPLQFSAFPSVLLISTLFRLALSVATTRMILLHADAGHIIDTFGTLVAGNNVVVGLVVFLIVTLVQFLVIAKGAERVAEVGARFTLDAMPGKQMSIDSDLRSGLIDKNEARAKRQEVELESKLHGSMDGAMKFVKGDAIAGIVIIIINLLGGLAVGVFQRGMDAGAAMSKYSILTIGDGMVAQIPALLGAMAAGLIVTRVTDTDGDSHLGDSIQKQFSAIPRVLMVAGAICFLMALVPGFPASIFVGLGLTLGILGASLVPALRSRMDSLSQPALDTMRRRPDNTPSLVNQSKAVDVQQAVALLLELPHSFSLNGQDTALLEAINEVSDSVQNGIGLPLPPIKFHWHKQDDKSWSFNVYEVPVAKGNIEPGTSVEELAAAVRDALRKHMAMFLGIQEASVLLTQASVDYPDIVKEALRSVPMQNVATILRNLVEEEVSIRNIRGILEALVQASGHEKDVANLTEFARIALARQICYRYAPDNVMVAVSVAPELEERLIQAARAGGGARQFSLDPAMSAELRAAMVAAINSNKATVIVTHLQIRRHLRNFIQEECFDVPVLSYNELVSSIDLTVAEQVRLLEQPAREIA
ncbi:MAG: flagellar biosynthesis protein FlhA [Granulosicoccaceae bacterium]